MNVRILKHELIKIAPKSVLRGYKLWKIMKVPAYRSPDLPESIFENCRVVSNRDKLLELLPSGGKVAEIGVEYGRFSKNIIRINRPVEYYGFDIDFSKVDPSVQTNDVCRVTLKEGDSPQLLKEFPDEFFDWIYIDGDHSYDGVKADIEAAKQKVKRGGFLVFNDFAHIVWASYSTFGVHCAVTEFLKKDEWPVRYWAYEQNALYDIVVERPRGE